MIKKTTKRAARPTEDGPALDLPLVRVSESSRLEATVSVAYRGPRDLAMLYRLAAVATILLGDEGLLDLHGVPRVSVHSGAGRPLAASVEICGGTEATPDGAILRVAERAALLAARGASGALEYRVQVTHR